MLFVLLCALASWPPQELHRFSFSVIKKWLPASMRSRNPGGEECLDLQVHTERGARDLRMRCADAAAVATIICQLQDTVKVGRCMTTPCLQISLRLTAKNTGGKPHVLIAILSVMCVTIAAGNHGIQAWHTRQQPQRHAHAAT
jgi:hypothetical protein